MSSRWELCLCFKYAQKIFKLFIERNYCILIRIPPKFVSKGSVDDIWTSSMLTNIYLMLTHCGLVTPYGDIECGQYWLRQCSDFDRSASCVLYAKKSQRTHHYSSTGVPGTHHIPAHEIHFSSWFHCHGWPSTQPGSLHTALQRKYTQPCSLFSRGTAVWTMGARLCEQWGTAVCKCPAV